MLTVTTTVTTTGLERYLAGLPAALQAGVNAEAVAVQNAVAQLERVDRGALRQSVGYVTADGGGTYLDHLSAAGELRDPSEGGDTFPPPPLPEAPGAVVAVGMTYGMPVNYGHVTTGGTHVAAQPFWEPGISTAAPQFTTHMRAALDRLL